MHWTVILTVLVLTATNAFLVIIMEWPLVTASLVVAGGAFCFILVLMILLWAMTKPEERPELWQLMQRTMRQDLDDLLRWIRIRR